MAVKYAEAESLLLEWTSSPSLIGHARAVEAAMRRAAHRYGAGEADEETCAIAGLVHDSDYDRWPEEHPNRVLAWLRERGEKAIAHAVACHFMPWDLHCEPPLDRALLACDELTGFVVACCLVRPDGIASLTPSSVKKKLRDRAFAAKVDRDDVRRGTERLGVEPESHIQLIIDAPRPHARELGIAGRPAAGA